MANLSLKNVGKIFPGKNGGAVNALADFNLDVGAREFLVVAGPACSGKSTLLRLIAGLEQATGGEIFIGEKNVNTLPPRERDVAMVFKTGALLPHATARENLAFGLRPRNFPKAEIEKRVNEAAGILRIGELLEKKPAELTTLQQQLVSIGRAIVCKPKVILFDEPLAELDGAARGQLRTEIKKLHQRLQTTFIYATRDQADALILADRVVLLNEGAIVQSAAQQEIYERPANLFAAGFFGAPPMNLIHGKIKKTNDALVFNEIGDGVIECKIADRASAEEFAGGEIVLGIRPEEIRILPEGAQAKSRVQGVLENVEPTGAETVFYFQTGAHLIAGRCAQHIGHEESGRRQKFDFDPDKAQFFDPVTTKCVF
jgi:multiple sugar transport system ATP-binding protein